MISDGASVRTFLIADIRGYTRFTQQYGDEAAAQLATHFADVVTESVQAHGGHLAEMRGDEALAVFASTRSALRSALDLQRRFVEGESDHPLPVGIGIDVGEAVPVGDGYRGAALNMAARLCAEAGPGEILVTPAVRHLAGIVDGITLHDHGSRRLKGMDEPVPVLRVETPYQPAPLVQSPIRDERAFEDRLSERIEAFVEANLERSLNFGERKTPVINQTGESSVRRDLSELTVAFVAAAGGIALLVLLVLAIWFIFHLL
ncbi:MAG TPA: adenylate/guanylate cyclase domain-containing protein [Chloroflexota bacterium]|nr:adenylate/guanylate cyclase domain-containing protein [Chloroflexota bacterium]